MKLHHWFILAFILLFAAATPLVAVTHDQGPAETRMARLACCEAICVGFGLAAFKLGLRLEGVLK